MPLTAQQIAYRLSLPPHPDGYRTGAVPLETDARDYPAYLHPGIWAAAAAGNLTPTDLLRFIKEPRYDQGELPACVAYSTGGNNTLAHSMADGSWPQYGAAELYREAGGNGTNGVDARTTLNICIKEGTPLSLRLRESVVRSYVFIDTTPGVARTQIKAALSAGFSVLIASLLPIPFGWNTGMVLSSAYHQYLGVGWMIDPQGVEWVYVDNSWGDAWPGDQPSGIPKGVGRIRFDALEQAGQSGYFYAIVPTDLSLSPPPPPPPSALTVTGVQPNPAVEGSAVVINGTGFTPKASAAWGTTPLLTAYLSTHQLIAGLPLNTGDEVIRVTSGGKTAVGPLLDIIALGPLPPPPPSPLTVTVTPYLGDRSHQFVHLSSTNPIPAGTKVAVTATEPDGTSATGEVTLP